jgi:hypothetical protein
MSYTKSSVKLLSVIDNFENHAVFYSEFDGNFKVGDKLYIMVVDSGSTEYSLLDSFQTKSTTYESIGYELLGKEGNKLILDIDYSGLTISLTSLISENCYIGRVYLRNGTIYNGSINGSLLYNISLVPNSVLSLLWYQGIIATTPLNSIQNIDFNSNTKGQLILKSEVLPDNSINSFYTIDNYNNGLSIINLVSPTIPHQQFGIQLKNCNINAGVYNWCEFILNSVYGYNNSLTNGIFNNCYIGSRYIISGATLNDCELENNYVIWADGIWNSTWSLTNDWSIGGNPFHTLIWSGGTWKNGIFPISSTWFGGRFMKGVFDGDWSTGTFGTIDSTSNDTIFTSSAIWRNGSFNGGIMSGSSWITGIFNNGVISGSTWNDGVFNNGTFTYCLHWYDGVFNDGTFSNSVWNNGSFNSGTFTDSIWLDGDFNDGNMINSTWSDGFFYDGKMENSAWTHGSFYNGSMFNCTWMDGDLFYGTMNTVDWLGGIWHNGTANNITFSGGTWKNGIFNFGYFYSGDWYNGSFNGGYFSGATTPSDAIWHGGNFYYGEFAGLWSGGTFFIGKETNIPQKDIIGRQYNQYNKSGLLSTKYNTVRLPAKKKY